MLYKCQHPKCNKEVDPGFLLTSHPGELIYELELKGWFAAVLQRGPKKGQLSILCPDHFIDDTKFLASTVQYLERNVN